MSSISSVSYQDILNLADYLNKSDEEKNNSSFEEKYQLMFANRNPMLTETGLSIDDTIGIRDFEALLDALIQKNNTNWIADDVIIGENTKIENSVILRGSSIGDNVGISNSIICSNSNIESNQEINEEIYKKQ